MSAIVKYIAIHESLKNSVKGCLDYIKDAEKTDITKAVAYIGNEEKTTIEGEKTILVTPVNCSIITADLEFQWCKDRYLNQRSKHLSDKPVSDEKNARSKGRVKNPIDAVHIIQSFSSDVQDPIEVHNMGLELVSKLYPGHDAVVASHVNKENVSGKLQYHNHILVCSYNKEGNRKIQYNMNEINRARYESDKICLERGQSILQSSGKALSYGEWKAQEINNNSWKDKLRIIIDQEKRSTNNWKSYKSNMLSYGYGVKENPKSVTYIISDNHKKIRDRTLGEAYTKKALEQYWSTDEKEIVEITQHTIDDALIWKMVNVSKIRMPKVENEKYKIWVSYYDMLGRKRSTMELLLIIWLKTIFFILLLFKDLLQYREMIYQELCQEYNKTLDILKKIRSYGITSKDELKQEMNTTGSEISHIKKQIKEIEEKLEQESSFEHDTNRTDSVALFTELENLQKKLKEMNRIYTELSKIKNVIEKAENPEYLFGLVKESGLSVDKTTILIKKVDNISDMPEAEQQIERQLEEGLKENIIIEENEYEIV